MREMRAGEARTTSTTSDRRGFLFGLLLFAAAGYGLAVFRAVLPQLIDHAPRGQLMAYMTVQGIDASSPFRAMAALILLPGIAALAFRPVAVRLASTGSAPWAAWMAAGSLLAALWARLAHSTSTATLVLTALAAVALLGARRLAIAFTALDTLLIPAFVVVYIALLEIAPAFPYPEAVLASLAAVLLLRIALGAADRPGRVPAAWCFSLVPAAHVLQIHVLQRHRLWPAALALAIALGSPIAIRLLVRWSDTAARRMRAVLVYASLPLFALAYPNSSTIEGYEGAYRIDFFEDGHHLLPASEMLRGERLYRDVVPGHGAISDGGLSWLAMRLFGARIDAAIETRHVVSSFNSVAVYALGVAATGSPPAGLLTLLFSSQVIPFGLPWLRSAPALAALAFMMSAARRRAPRRLAGAGAFLVLALLTSVEMGMYSFAVLVLAVARFGDWRARLRALQASAAGALAAAVPVAAFFAVRGTFDDMLRVTVFEVLSLGPVYVLGFGWAPPALRSQGTLPEALLTIFDPSVFRILLWVVVVLATAAGLAASPLRAQRRTEPLWLLGGWVAAAGFSFAERHHDYFIYGLAPFLAIGTFLLWRSRSAPARSCGAVALVALAVIARPTARVNGAAWIHNGQLPPQSYVEFTALPRARGALFHRDDAAKLESARAFVQTALRPSETFYDFANMPILYFLLDRPCPIRQMEVPFYQSEERQREVIARLESDRSVRAALMSFSTVGGAAIDNVYNHQRAPLVWKWLRRNFRPAYSRDGVVFWMRRDDREGHRRRPKRAG
ncbi:MAG TPA: hypothetical protein VF756_13765 [Thermoanaerobaculia bacterium]